MKTKFRVWNKNSCEYLYPKRPPRPVAEAYEPILITLDGLVFIRGENGQLSEQTSRFVVQQFTGLKDFKGCDIYEGDIVKIYTFFLSKDGVFCDRPQYQWLGITSKVSFRDGMFCVWTALGSEPANQYRLEVIGNIFENAELLT